MSEKTNGEIWASLEDTQPIPLWDVENGKFIADMDYAEPIPAPPEEPQLSVGVRLIRRALESFSR
jgi:hypothetical protein